MSLVMPTPDQAVLDRRDSIIVALRQIVPDEGVIDKEAELRPHESDGLTAYRQMPMVVVLPETTVQVSQILQWCHANRIKVVPRGSGTSLSGGALPLADAVLLGLGKFKRILDIDYDDRVVVVQPGVTNLAITQAAEERGFYYAPDPSSQIALRSGVLVVHSVELLDWAYGGPPPEALDQHSPQDKERNYHVETVSEPWVSLSSPRASMDRLPEAQIAAAKAAVMPGGREK